MRLLVVGAGEMGRWIADTVTASPAAFEESVEITFTDADAAVAIDAAQGRDATIVTRENGTGETNRAEHPIEETPVSEGFDAICLAVPIPAVEDAIDEWAPHAKTAIFDVAGIMETPLSAMETAAAKSTHPFDEYGSFHPLFAPPRMPGNVAYVPGEEGKLLKGIKTTIRAGGNDLFETTAVRHDEAMKTVQASAHAAILAYGLVAADADIPDAFHTPVSSQLEELVETITEGSPDVYADIQQTFDGADAIAESAQQVSAARLDREAFISVYRSAGKTRENRERHE